MDRQIIDSLYRAFLNKLVVSYSATVDLETDERFYEIVYVENRMIKTNLYIKVYRDIVDVSVMEEAPRYPVYDSNGNIVYYGV